MLRDKANFDILEDFPLTIIGSERYAEAQTACYKVGQRLEGLMNIKQAAADTELRGRNSRPRIGAAREIFADSKAVLTKFVFS